MDDLIIEFENRYSRKYKHFGFGSRNNSGKFRDTFLSKNDDEFLYVYREGFEITEQEWLMWVSNYNFVPTYGKVIKIIHYGEVVYNINPDEHDTKTAKDIISEIKVLLNKLEELI